MANLNVIETIIVSIDYVLNGLSFPLFDHPLNTLAKCGWFGSKLIDKIGKMDGKGANITKSIFVDKKRQQALKK